MSTSTHRCSKPVAYFVYQLLITQFLLVILTANAQTTWTARQGFNLKAITSKNGRFVGVGANNTVATSTNGTTWLKSLASTSTQLNGVTAGSGIMGVVAVGMNGTIIGSTTEGLSWSIQASPTSNSLYDVAYGASLYVAVGDNSTILTSPNGINWTTRYVYTPGYVSLRGITYGGGQFVAVGYGGFVLTSSNGINWSVRTTSKSSSLEDVAYGNGKYVAVGGYPDNGRLISTDGITWTSQLPTAGTNYNLYDITYGNGQFVAVGYYGAVLTSFDASTWTKQDIGLLETMQGVAWANNQFVVAGTSIRMSYNGSTWQATNAPDGLSNLYGVAYGNGRYVALGASYSNGSKAEALVSTDGITFTRTEFGNYTSPSDVAFGQGLFVSVDYYGNILTSPDGVTWTFRKQGSGYKAIIYDNFRFVAVGTGQAAVSTDGLTWTTASMQTSASFQDITYGNGLYVAVGTNGAIYTSPTGLTWKSRVSNSANTLSGIAYGNGYFVAVGNAGGNVRQSTDGITWTGSGNTSGVNPGSITFGNGQFVIAGNTSITTTPDGLNPVSKSTPPYIGSLNTISYLNGQFMAVGQNLTILTAPADPMPFSISGVTFFSCDVMVTGTPYRPEIRAVRFAPSYSGIFTPPMSFSVTGLLSPTSNPDAVIYPAVDNPTVTIVARDAQGRTASFAWNWLSRCTSGTARQAAEEVSNLQVVVLGNPTRNEAVEVEISGAADDPVSLNVVNEQGILVSQQQLERTNLGERHLVKLGSSTGLYLLNVQTATQTKTVKLLKQ